MSLNRERKSIPDIRIFNISILDLIYGSALDGTEPITSCTSLKIIIDDSTKLLPTGMSGLPLLNKYFISDIIRACLMVCLAMMVRLPKSLFTRVFICLGGEAT